MTTLNLHHELYRFIGILCGVHKAPGTFQRNIDVITSSVKLHFAIVYIDNILIFRKAPERYIERIWRVQSSLDNAGTTLKLRKCNFLTNTINDIGEVVCFWHLELASSTTHIIWRQKPPANITELWTFFGLCNVFQRFFLRFARMASPLNQNIKK